MDVKLFLPLALQIVFPERRDVPQSLNDGRKMFDERHVKTLSRRIMITYPLLITLEHALSNWPLVDFRKERL